MPFRMAEDRLAWDLQHAPSVKLLKAEHAALVIGFLYNQFKVAQRVTIPLVEVVEQLDGYLESLNEHEPSRYARTAQAYINEWADPQHQFLRIAVSSANSIPVVELTADTERAIGWLEDMQMRRAIGTEPRFLLIVQILYDIIQNSINDPEKLLKQLERQHADLDRQINTISFSKHTVTIFLDSDLLVWYHLILSYTFAIFSAILFFRSYSTVSHGTIPSR